MKVMLMKTKLLLTILLLAVSLSGCAVFQGQYHRVTPHKMQSDQREPEAYSARSYGELRIILGNLVASGAETGIIYSDGLDYDALERDMDKAVKTTCSADPIGAFAVDTISYEVGSNSGKTAAAITIQYRRNPEEIQKLSRVEDIDEANKHILESLEDCDAKLAMYIQAYRKTDFTQIVRDLSLANPQTVMEIPQVQESVYGEGQSRVVELTFTYENGRDDMRRMQSQVRPIFDAAALYVSGEGSDNQKFAQLYVFLMERFDYSYETSITPAYSLLRHGVGDSRAFATVYSAMCRKAGLDCRIVTGTRMGEPWVWNIVCDADCYYHVDLLRCSEKGMFQEKTDQEMTGYVWDYSAYPVCSGTSAATETAPGETEKENFEESEK